MAKLKKLSVKMLSFIDAYVGAAGGNAIKAYDLSQYSSNGTYTTRQTEAYRLLDRPEIREEIDRRLTARSAAVEDQMTPKIEVKPDYLLGKLFQIIEAEQERNPQAALRAVELAGKAIALWKERQEISGPDGTAIQHEQHVKESVADFTSKLEQLKSRRTAGESESSGTGNVVSIADRRAESGT